MKDESVWDYPRPPRLEACSKKIEIIFGDTIAITHHSYRILETSHPPTFYIPRETFEADLLIPKTLSEKSEK